MALIACRECGKEISNKATACPQCGSPTRGYVSPRRKAIGAGILATIVAAFLVIGWLDHQGNERMRQAEQARQADERAYLMQPKKIVDETVELKEGNYVTYSFSLKVNSNVQIHVAADPKPVHVIVLPEDAVARFKKDPSGSYTYMPSLSGKQLLTMDKSSVLPQGEWVLVVFRPQESVLFGASTAANVVVTAAGV